MFCIQCQTEKAGSDFYPKHKSKCKACCKANATAGGCPPPEADGVGIVGRQSAMTVSSSQMP